MSTKTEPWDPPTKAKKRKATGRKIKVKAPPSVPEYAIWTDAMTDHWFMLWPAQKAEAQPSLETAAKAADKKIREDERVRMVGIYKLVATVRPDRTPITTTLETKTP